MPTDWGIYQLLGRGVSQENALGGFQQGAQFATQQQAAQQRSALGQLALEEAQRQRQVDEQVRAAYRRTYGQGGTTLPAPGGGAPPGGAVQETVNTPYSSELQAMLAQYQQEGADVSPTPGARTLPSAGGGTSPPPVQQAPMARSGLAGIQQGVDTTGLVRDLYQIDPQAGMAAEKAARDSHTAHLEMLGKQNSMVSQVARAILLSDTQQGYEVGVNYLRQAGIPVDHLPPIYDRRMVEHYYAMSTDAETRITEQKNVLDAQKNRLAGQRLELDIETEERLQRAEGRAETKAQREEREAAQAVPPYTSDSTLNVAIDQEMQAAGMPRGSQPPGAILDKAMQRVQQGKVDVSRSQGEAGALAKPLEGPALQRVNTLMQGEDVVKALQTEFTPEERRKYVGLGGLRMSAQQAQQLLADATEGKADPKFARFAALVALGKQEAFSTAGQALSGHERDVVFGYIPTGKEWSAEEFEQKLTLSGQRLPTLIDRELTLSTTPREQLAKRRRRGELPSLTPGSPTAAPLKDFTEADIAEAMRQTKRSRAEVLDLARKTKKYRVPEQ